MDEIDSRILHSEGHTDVTFDETGSLIITGGGEGDVRILESFDGDDVTAQTGTGSVYAVACKRGRVVLADDDCNVQALKLPGGEPDGIVARFSMPVYCVCFNADGTWIGAGASDFEIKLVELSSGNQKVLRNHEAPILSLSFDPLDKYLASASCDGTVRIWRLMNYAVCQTLNVLKKSNDRDTAESLCRIAWKPADGKYLAVPVGRSAQFYERESWELAFSLQHDQGGDGDERKTVNVIIWSPCGSYVASGCIGGDVFIWSVNDRKALKVFSTEPSPITALCWHPKLDELLYANTMGKIGEFKLQAVIRSQQVNVENVVEDDQYGSAGLFDDADDDQMNAFLDIEAAEAEDYDGKNEDDTEFVSVRKKSRVMAFEDESDEDVEDDVLGDIDNREPTNDSVIDASLLEALKEDKRKDDGMINSVKGAQVPVCRCPPPTEIQKPFLPGSTPEILTSRFMAYNLIGSVRQNNEDNLSTIDIEFHNASHHHSIHLSNHLSHTMASLSSMAVLLACEKSEESPSKLQCLHFGSWDTAKEWVCSMSSEENIKAIGVSDCFAAVATSHNFLRIFTITGIQRSIWSLPGPVISVTLQGALVFVVFHQGQGLSGEQNLGFWLLDMGRRQRQLVAQHCLPLTPKSTLTWIGFMSSGLPTSYDSAGVIRVFNMAGGNVWQPVANLRDHLKGKSHHYWIIGIDGTLPQIRCILCKGLTYPTTLPRPVPTTLPLNLPVCEQFTEKGQLEERFLRASMFATSDDDIHGRLANNKESITILMKMFALACKADREFRAAEIASLLPDSQTISLAIKYASRMKRLPLAQRLDDLARQRDEEEEEESDDELEEEGTDGYGGIVERTHLSSGDRRMASSVIKVNGESVNSGSFQAIQLNRQQETLKQRQKTSTPEIESDSELEEEERASTDAAPTATSSTVRHETRSIAAANPFKKAECLVSDSTFNTNSGFLDSLSKTSPAVKRLDISARKRFSLNGEDENKERPVKRISKAKRLEAAAVQLWINANKELLEKEISDLSGDAFNKQCTSLFKKLGKEEKKEWISKAREDESLKNKGADKQAKKRCRSNASKDESKPNKQPTLNFFGHRKAIEPAKAIETLAGDAVENEGDEDQVKSPVKKPKTQSSAVENEGDEDEMTSPVKKPKTQLSASKLSQFSYNKSQ